MLVRVFFCKLALIMMPANSRWVQRLLAFNRAFGLYQEGVQTSHQRLLSRLEQQGLVKGFEYTYELAWKLMKDYGLENGMPEISGSKDAIRAGLRLALIADGDGWMDMVQARIETVHTYDMARAEEILHDISHRFYDLLKLLHQEMNLRAKAE